jgi:hypothetical protein
MAAVLVGSCIGLVLHSKLPQKIVTIVFQAIGLFTLGIGFIMASKTSSFLIVIFSLVIGAILGELLNLESGIDNLSERLRKKIGSPNDRFSEGLVTAFLLFCTGSMTILGAFEEGLGGKPNLLLAKSLMDGCSSIALSSALGTGVLFSVIPLLIYQGGLTLFAGALGSVFSQPIINELTAVGGILLIGLGINILEIKRLRIVNMLPALVIVVVLAYFFL